MEDMQIGEKQTIKNSVMKEPEVHNSNIFPIILYRYTDIHIYFRCFEMLEAYQQRHPKHQLLRRE